MGHSSKAGENIFWAMNRNKPGIIKRILNALERFIARIRGKDAYLAVEQRQAAERLRDMLTGELKRAYGTEVKGEAAVESGEGKRHSLAGANSRTADLNSLGGAYQMYQNGVSMDTIRKRTGWWLGKDGKWRYEISDKEMRFNPEGYVDNPQTVGDYVKHDRLFAAYPWIMDVNVLMSENVAGDPNSLGRYVPSENFIELKTGVPTEKTKHVLIHELQHAIQNKEHFTNGTNSTVTSRYIVNLAYNNVKNNPEFKAEKSPRGKMDYIIGYLEARMDANFDDIAKYYYSRNHGEIEAQYVDKRLDMSDNARKAEPIVNYGDVYTREDVRADFIDNLKEMGYNEEQVNEILEEGIPYDNKHQNEQESLGQTGEGRKNLAGEAGRLPRQGTQRGERREVYRTGKVQVADSVKKTGQVDSLSDSTIFRRGRTDSETGRNDVREAQKRLNEVSKPEKRFSLSSADTDIYSRIFDMQREETELTNRIREIEKSDAFKNANNDLSKAIDSDNIAEGMKAYQAWRKESGYADLVDRRDALRAELEEIRTKAYNDAVSKAINEERTAIEKSGLSEADYFRKQAVKEFGYTPYFYDAGYIMPNGKMLNFSGEKGRHYGSRGQDHRAIGTIYADTNGTDALVRFMNDGNIRIMAETPGLDISASTEPSKEQYTTIRRFANEFSDGGYFAVDLSDENGKTVGTLEYEGNINPTRIVNDIKHFYETGEVREQSGLDRFRYSLTRANDEYMKAVESGDTEEQRRLVDEAAKESGYDRLFWHGSKNGGGFTEFRDWSYFTENKKYASRYAKAGDKGSLYEVYANLGNAFDTRKPECREIFDKMRSEYGLSKVQESGLPDWTDGYDIAEFIDENGLDYDSIILDEGGDLVDGKPVSRGFSYVIRSSEQVKSADPITYDDSGNVIPLTERFDSGNRDIRWSLAGNSGITTEITDDSYDEYEGGYQRRDIKLNGETVGTVAIRIYDDYSEIDRIDIDEKYRNKGIGTTVLGDIAGEFDTTYIVPDNESAKRLYERIGEEVTSGEVYENLDQGYGVYRLDKSYGNTRWSLAGTNKDGIEVYETSDEVMNMPEKDREKRFLDYIRYDYRGRTARFYKNGHYYYAHMETPDAKKMLFGEKRSSKSGKKALVRTLADGSYFDLVENSDYKRGALEQGKNTKAHKDVIAWDYFVKTVQIDNKVYDLFADVKKKSDGEYVYTLHMTDSNKKAAPAQHHVSGVKKVAETASIDNSVSQNDPVVNTQSMQDVEKDSSDERHSLVKSAQSETETIEAEDKAIKNVLEKFSKERYYKSGYPYKFNEFLNRIADLSETSGERIPREQLLDTVKRLFRYAYENRLDGKALGRDYRHDTDILAAMVGDIENEIYDWVSPLRDEYNEARDAKKKLRMEKIFIPTEIRASVAKAAGFETWSDFRKSLFGIVGLVNEQKGRALSEVYAELSEIYPEYFPDNITDGTEQAVLIADLARNMRVNGIGESNVLSYEEQLVKKSIGRAISELLYNGENTVSINAMRKRISQLKEQREKAITSLKEKYAEQFKNRSEKQKQTVLRNKVLRKYTEASSMLDRPTTENHFTEAMREPIMEFLAAVDITTGKSVAKQGVYDRILRVIEAANKATAEGDENGLGIAETDLNVQEKQLIVDSGLLERMAAWVEANQGKKLTELSSAQLFDQIVSNEPPVGYVHLDLLQQPYFAADTVRISYEQHTEKNLRLDSRASVILAVIRLADSAGTSFSNTILSQA